MTKPVSLDEQRRLRKLERLRIERERLILRRREVDAEIAAISAQYRRASRRDDEETRS